MTSAPDRPGSETTDSDPFRHLAVIHHGIEELLDALAPLARAAVDQGDRVWAVVDHATREGIERRLGAAASGVVFGDPGQPHSYSGQTMAACRADRLREAIGGGAALVLSDATPVGGADPDSFAPDVWSVAEASSNLALSGLPVTLVCLCDAERTGEDTERVLYWNHPELIVGAAASPNPRYRSPAEVLRSTPPPPAPALGTPDHELAFADSAALRGVRAAAKRHGFEAGLDAERVDGLVLAVGELVSNSIEHGAGHGTLSWWVRTGRLVVEIHDPGHMSTTTPGLRRPSARSARGRGVWLARQLSDVVHLWTTVDGTHARLEVGP